MKKRCFFFWYYWCSPRPPSTNNKNKDPCSDPPRTPRCFTDHVKRCLRRDNPDTHIVKWHQHAFWECTQKKICKWKYSRRSLGFPDKASVQRSLSTSSGSASQSLNMAEKVGITSIFTFAIYNFYQFVTDYPLALQVAIETAKESDELKAALGGGKITSPFHKRIFWGGNVSAKTGKIQIDVPVVSTKSGKEATIKGKGLQDVYGKMKFGIILFTQSFMKVEKK